MRVLVALITLIGVAGGGGLYVMRGEQASVASAIAPEMLHTVTRGKLRVTITENGELLAQNSEKATPEMRRGGTITWLIEEGRRVEQDELLAQLDTTDLEERKTQLELEIVRTEADLDTARTELEIQSSENTATIEKASIALSRARQELEKYTLGDVPKERRELEIDIKDKETAFERAKKKYEDSLRLLKEDYITRSQAEQDRIDYERAQVQLVSSERNLDLFEKYTYPLTLLDKETAVKDAQRELDNAEKRAKSLLRQKEVAVESQQSRLKQQQDSLQEALDQIEQCTINAPVPGIVLYGDPDEPWYRSDIKIGGRIWGGVTMFTIPDLRVMQVKIHVHEADINKMKDGQSATVTMDTYPGLVLTGKVTKIASIAGSGGSPWEQNDEVKRFAVNITLDTDPDVVLRPGISAKAEIFIEDRNNVMFVPIQCVYLEGGAHYAWRLGTSGQPERVRVEPGMSNESFIEIVSGLEEGDRVLLYNPRIRVGDDDDAEAEGDEVPADDSILPVDEHENDSETEDAGAADDTVTTLDAVSDDDAEAVVSDGGDAVTDEAGNGSQVEGGESTPGAATEPADSDPAAGSKPDEDAKPEDDAPGQQTINTPAGSTAVLSP